MCTALLGMMKIKSTLKNICPRLFEIFANNFQEDFGEWAKRFYVFWGGVEAGLV